MASSNFFLRGALRLSFYMMHRTRGLYVDTQTNEFFSNPGATIACAYCSPMTIILSLSADSLVRRNRISCLVTAATRTGNFQSRAHLLNTKFVLNFSYDQAVTPLYGMHIFRPRSSAGGNPLSAVEHKFHSLFFGFSILLSYCRHHFSEQNTLPTPL